MLYNQILDVAQRLYASASNNNDKLNPIIVLIIVGFFGAAAYAYSRSHKTSRYSMKRLLDEYNMS